MYSTRMTSKGRLIIPKRIRDAVRARPGTVFTVRLEGSRIVLEVPRSKDPTLADWPGLNPAGTRLGRAALCAAGRAGFGR